MQDRQIGSRLVVGLLTELDRVLDGEDETQKDRDGGENLIAAGPLSCLIKSVGPGLNRGRAAAAGPVITG